MNTPLLQEISTIISQRGSAFLRLPSGSLDEGQRRSVSRTAAQARSNPRRTQFDELQALTYDIMLAGDSVPSRTKVLKEHIAIATALLAHTLKVEPSISLLAGDAAAAPADTGKQLDMALVARIEALEKQEQSWGQIRAGLEGQVKEHEALVAKHVDSGKQAVKALEEATAANEALTAQVAKLEADLKLATEAKPAVSDEAALTMMSDMEATIARLTKELETANVKLAERAAAPTPTVPVASAPDCAKQVQAAVQESTKDIKAKLGTVDSLLTDILQGFDALPKRMIVATLEACQAKIAEASM